MLVLGALRPRPETSPERPVRSSEMGNFQPEIWGVYKRS